jgi:maleylpyruvate isomerase
MTTEVVAAIVTRTRQLVDTLAALEEREILAPSLLPGWTRLTISCHLRYGAEALVRMTDDALAGRHTSFYPGGRAAQRPRTLIPGPGETATALIASLRDVSAALSERWRCVLDWTAVVREPEGTEDLGTVSLQWLALLRLTEVEVHGSDLGLGLPAWGEVFVRKALPMRLAWLARRRTNHRSVPTNVQRSWLLSATDGGPSTLVTVSGGAVHTEPATRDTVADVVIEATSRELLALILGRSTLEVAAEFGQVLPGP